MDWNRVPIHAVMLTDILSFWIKDIIYVPLSIYVFLCFGVLSVYVCLCTHVCLVPAGIRKGYWISWNCSYFELPRRYWELNLIPLEASAVNSEIAQPSLSSHLYFESIWSYHSNTRALSVFHLVRRLDTWQSWSLSQPEHLSTVSFPPRSLAGSGWNWSCHSSAWCHT